MLICARRLRTWAKLIEPHKPDRSVNQVNKLSEVVLELPDAERSADPAHEFLPAICEAGPAGHLESGEMSGLLAIEGHNAARMVSLSDSAALFSRKGHK